MSNYIKSVKKNPSSSKPDFPRGSLVDESLYRIVVNESDDTPILSFGRNPKDIIEFTLYNEDNQIIKSKIVEPDYKFTRQSFDYIDYNNERKVGHLNIFNSGYELDNNKNVVISPTHELRKLGEDSGSFIIGVSLKNESIGSYESNTKLTILDISPSRTEITVVPETLKTSKRPTELALNNEYNNFIKRQIPVSHIFHEIDFFLEKKSLRVHIEKLIEKSYLIEGYETEVLNVVDYYNLNSIDDFMQECQILYDNIRTLYKNIFYSFYNNTFKQSRFEEEYVKCVNFYLNSQSKFNNLDETTTKIRKTYETTLTSLFNREYVESIYTEKFDSYLNHIMVFSDKVKIPILSQYRGTEETTDKHTPLYFKLSEPLPTDLRQGSLFHLVSNIYSDDIIQRVILYKKVKSKLYKLRSPDLSSIAKQGTKSYSSEELNLSKQEIEKNSLLNLETDDIGILEKIKEVEAEMREEQFGIPLKITEEISKYFNNQTEDYYLNVDYSEFKNFVRYSSARKRLDVFILKLTKLSDFDRELENIRRAWRNNTNNTFDRLSYDSQVKKLNEEKLSILNNLDGYERFLYFEDISTLTKDAEKSKNKIDELTLKIKKYGNNQDYLDQIEELTKKLLYTYVSWPRAEFDCDSVDDWSPNIYDYVTGDAVLYDDTIWIADIKYGENISGNELPGKSTKWNLFCRCGECVGKKIPMNTENYVFLSSRTFYRPMPIPATMTEFTKTTGYSWYAEKAKEADFYDKHNDNSLLNNTPEFLVRDNNNQDYFDFLSFIGHQFDLIHLYIEGLGNIKQPLNNPDKGIPNEMVSHMLGFFGGNFEGYDDDEINALSNQVKTEKQLDFIKKFKEKKHIIWRRILNNLPYILKTIGTEKSIRALFRCYGVPDYLFRVREFGGIEYNTETSDKVLYTFDTFDYHIVFSKENQYIELDWYNENTKPKSIEFKFSLNENLCDVVSNVEIITGHSNQTKTENFWSFSYRPLENNNEGWGEFVLKVGDREVKLKNKKDKTEVFAYSKKEFNVLIQINESEKWNESGVIVYVKRYSDEDIVYDGVGIIALKPSNLEKFTKSTKVTIGNYFESNFFGYIDRLRIYGKTIKEERFENHVKFNQAYDIENPKELSEHLIFKANFDYPYYVGKTDGIQYGIIENTSFTENQNNFAKCFNFDKSEYPYDFGGENKRQFARLPSYGAQVFNNNKIRIEEQQLETQLSVSKRSTKKSGDRFTIDTNKLGVYFSPTDLINHEILRFFGDFELGNYIGDPMEMYNKTYEGFKEVQNTFFKHGFGKLDFSYYLSVLESYLDPSLFKNIENIIPARTQLISGLVVEPSLLERNKIKRRPIKNEILKLNDLNIKGGLRNKKIISFGNARKKQPIQKSGDEVVTGYDLKLNYKRITSETFPVEINQNYIKNITNDLMYSISTYRGTSFNKKIEKSDTVYSRYLKKDSEIKKYEGIRSSGEILLNSYVDAELFGDTSNQPFYVHIDTKLNGKKIANNYINLDNFKNDYALFKFNFNGHKLTGKIKGIAGLVMQNGLIENFRIVGKIGGKFFTDCDINKNNSVFSGKIKELVANKILSGTYLRKVKYDNSEDNRVDFVEYDTQLNTIDIPGDITHKIKFRLSKKTNFTLKNNSSKYITSRGVYLCNINLFFATILRPPNICTFNISWTSVNKKTNLKKKILSFRKSSYDYFNNLNVKESLDKRNFREDFELPTLEVNDTTAKFKKKKQKRNDFDCEERDGRYIIPEIDNNILLNENKTKLNTFVGNIIQTKNYSIDFDFNQKLRTKSIDTEFNLITEFISDRLHFKIVNEKTDEVFEITESKVFNLKGDHTKNYVENNTINLHISADVDIDVKDKVLLKNTNWVTDNKYWHDLNNIFFDIISIKKNSENDLQTITIKTPEFFKNENLNNYMFLPGGELHIIPTNIKFNHNSENYDYELDINVDFHKDKIKTIFPSKSNKDIKVGDRVSVVFREGSFLWKKNGIRVIEDGIVVEIDKVNDKISVNYGKNILLIKPDLNSSEVFEVIPDSEDVYRFVVKPNANDTQYNYTIEYAKKYNLQLGPNPSPLSLRKFDIDLQVDNNILLNSYYEFYNLIDIGIKSASIKNGLFKTHRRYFRNNFRKTIYNRKNLHCRRSISTINNTVDTNGQRDNSPPIVRTRRASLRNGIGDTFWYLEDTSYNINLKELDEVENEHTPTPTQHSDIDYDSLEFHYDFEEVNIGEGIVIDKSINKRNATLVGGEIKSGGDSRNYKQVLFLDNNIRKNEENNKSVLKIDSENPISTDKCTISFWIKLVGESEDNAGIIINNTSERSNKHGIVLNVNGNKNSLGYAWKNSEDSHLVDLNIKIRDNEWTHVSFIFYEIGTVNVFVNNVYEQNYDLGLVHEKITFDNLEIGNFSGMIDDMRFYSDELSYGNVDLKENCKDDIKKIYESTRFEQVQDLSSSFITTECEQMPYLSFFKFEYYQQREFRESAIWYLENKEKINDPNLSADTRKRMKFYVNGGANDGKLKYATVEFMGNMCGDIKEAT